VPRCLGVGWPQWWVVTWTHRPVADMTFAAHIPCTHETTSGWRYWTAQGMEVLLRCLGGRLVCAARVQGCCPPYPHAHSLAAVCWCSRHMMT
jgi:hypothetical protein